MDFGFLDGAAEAVHSLHAKLYIYRGMLGKEAGRSIPQVLKYCFKHQLH